MKKIRLKKDSIKIKVPLVRQATNYTCGVACVCSVLRYAGYDFDIRQDDLERTLKASYAEGTHYKEIVDYLNGITFRDSCMHPFTAKTAFGLKLSDLLTLIDEGKLCILAIQAWDYAADYRLRYDSGHYAIAVGYDETNIFFMDPSTLGTYTFIPQEEFINRWHDEDSEAGRLDQFAVIVTVKPDYDTEDAYYMA